MDVNTIMLCGGGNAAHALIPIIRTHFQDHFLFPALPE